MLSSILSNFGGDFVGMIGKSISKKINKIKEMAVEVALGFVFFCMAVLFGLTALMFFLKEYLQLNYTTSFLCTGIVALIIAYAIYKILSKE
jgi:uncharacterized membrane protein AbrB (regulator of aidB expression)